MKVKEKSLLLLCCFILLTGCFAKPQREETLTLIQEEAVTFADGQSADLWRPEHFGRNIYKLSDGTTLLTIHDTAGLADFYVGGVESLNDLNNTAQKAIQSYYKEQGLLYDAEIELNKAYAEYVSCKSSGELFSDLLVSQDIMPTASNEDIICFLTSVTLPIGGRMAQEIRLGAVFNKETGESMNTWDLFNLPQEETEKKLLSLSQITDEALLKEMQNALKPEYIALFPDNLEITFPRGTLPSQEHSFSIGFDYDDLQGLIQAWAVPQTSKMK